MFPTFAGNDNAEFVDGMSTFGRHPLPPIPETGHDRNKVLKKVISPLRHARRLR
jgi:hypothetical protein